MALTSGSMVYDKTIEDIITLSRVEGNEPGIYDIIVANNSTNYKVASNSATYKINPRKVYVKVNDAKSIYGNEFSDIRLSIVEGALVDNDDLKDLINVTCNYENIVGEYDITATAVNNPHYNISILYSGTSKSIYEVVRRPITITANDINVDIDANWDLIEENIGYTLNGGLVDGDNLNIEMYIQLDDGERLNKDNFDLYFAIGVYPVVVEASNASYDITLVNGSVNVSKRIIKLGNLTTEYIYNDGETIIPFNWEENIIGYNSAANDNSFAYSIMKENHLGEYAEVDEVVETGKYKIIVSVLHTHTFEFKEGESNEYEIIVSKKNISSEISFYNISGNIIEYSEFGVMPGVELTDEYSYVNYFESLKYGNKEVITALDVGKYTYTVIIDDDNYEGEKTVEFEIVKKDISSSIAFTISPGEVIVLSEEINIGVTVNNYNVEISKNYVKLSGTSSLDNSISEEGLYRLDVTIIDDCYKGEKSIQFKVVPSVSSKIETLGQIRDEIAATETLEDKQVLIDRMQSIMDGLTESDLDQINDSEEYQSVIESCEKTFDNFNLEMQEAIAKDSMKKGSNSMWIFVFGSLFAVAVIALFIVVYTRRNKYNKTY